MFHGGTKAIKLRPRRIEVLWKTNPELVREEISRLKSNAPDKPEFELRTAASKRIIANMTQEEIKVLDDAATDMAKNGYSEEHQRR
jgi:hypothetical protein